MSKEFQKLMNAHEFSDKDYIKRRDEIVAKIREEMENAEDFLSYLKSDEKACNAFFDYAAAKPYPFSVIPIRKSEKLYAKKHTATQRPYYHSHDFYELIFVQKGKCDFFTYPNGEKYRIDKGSACIFAPSSVHALARAGKNDVVLKAVVPCSVFKAMFGDSNFVADSEIRIFYNIGDKAQAYFHNFMTENSSSESLARIAERNWLALFIVELFREKYKKDGDIAEKFDVYIEDSLKNANLTDFAKFAGYNADYVSRVLKRDTGKSFMENVTIIKLAKAKFLLRSTDMSVDSIAAEVGYQNTSGFYKQFTATFGITPAQYRQSQR